MAISILYEIAPSKRIRRCTRDKEKEGDSR
jgi:hypothetical protein